MEAVVETPEMPADSDKPEAPMVTLITLDQDIKKLADRVKAVEQKTEVFPILTYKILFGLLCSAVVGLVVAVWNASGSYSELKLGLAEVKGTLAQNSSEMQRSNDSLSKRMTDMEQNQGEVREHLALLHGELDILRQRSAVEHRDAGAGPTYPRLYWCQLRYITERRWRGVDTIIDATHTWRFLAVPGRGLLRPEDVPGQGPATGYSVTIERTAWGFGPGGTDASVRMGLRADIDGQRYCYEYTGSSLEPTPCRENVP